MKMNASIMRRWLSLGLACVCVGGVGAGEASHYVNGVEGIKAASLPPPGVYGRWYNLYYGAGHLRDSGGDKIDPDFKVNAWATVPRLIWITPVNILGADYGMDALVPIQQTDLKIGAMGLRDKHSGIGDLFVEPVLLSWRKDRFDVSAGLGIYFPTGNFEQDQPASPGQGFYTYMGTLGGTYYIDPAKTWAASVLSRYEINSYKRTVDIKPGNSFHFEWGLSKNLAKVWELGLVGYCQWQVTDDRGSDIVGGDGSVHDQVYAAGPEVCYFVQPAMLNVSLRYEQEFLARDRSEGSVTTLTLTKIF